MFSNKNILLSEITYENGYPRRKQNNTALNKINKNYSDCEIFKSGGGFETTLMATRPVKVTLMKYQ